MELDNIGALAVRVLATDLANLTARLAVMTAVMEDLVMRVNGLDQSSWQPVSQGDEAVDNLNRGFVMCIPGPEMNKLQEIIQEIRSMQ